MDVRDGKRVEEENDRIALVEKLDVLADVLRVVEVLASCVVEHKVERIFNTFLSDGVDERYLRLLVGDPGLGRKNASLEKHIVEVGLIPDLCAVLALVGNGGSQDAEVAQLAAILAKLVDEHCDIVGFSTASGTDDGNDIALVLYHFLRDDIVTMRADNRVGGMAAIVANG